MNNVDYTQIGRNDPCPCGSGKKYKKCCAALEEIGEFSTDPFIRYSQVFSAIKIKLDQFYGQQIKKIRKTTQERFLLFTVEKKLPPEHETLFSDWLWFDKTDEEGDTMGFFYLKDNSKFMHGLMTGCLTALNFSYLSVYEVAGFDDVHLEVEDIFSGNQYKVLLKEPWDIEMAEQAVLILGRLAMLPSGDNVFSGMVLLSDNKSGQKDFIKEHMDYINQLHDGKITNLLKFNGEILYGLFDHALKKVLISMNNMQSIAISAEESQTLKNSMLANHNYTLEHETGGFSWFKPAGQEFGYVRIAVGNEYVLSCAEVLEDVLQQNELLQSILTDHEVINLNNRFVIQSPPLELSDLWFMALKDRECERWMGIPQSDLSGRTPRELLQEEDGSERLLKILDEFSKNLNGENEQELVEYMRNRISK